MNEGITGASVRSKVIRSHRDLLVYAKAFEASMEVFELSKSLPREEMYSLTDQIRRSSRSVSANIAEAWRKRRYPLAFASKLTDAEGEAAETQVHLEYTVKCGYISRSKAASIYREYEQVVAMLVAMTLHPNKWTRTESRVR